MTDTLCIFDGIMETKDSYSYKGPMSWHGVWLVSKSKEAKLVNEPQRDPSKQMVDSDMKFRVEGSATPIAGKKDTTWAQPCTISWTDGAFEGRVTIQDTKHELLVNKLRWTGGDQIKNIVYGSGENKFGKFIEVGWMRPGNRLTMARRYVIDERASWSLEKLKEFVLADIFDEEEDEVVMPPWHCDIFNSNYEA